MATVFFNVGNFIATVGSSDSSRQVIVQGEVVTIPDAFEAGANPWDAGVTNFIRIEPSGEDDIANVSTEPPATNLTKFESNWFWRDWDSNTDYIVSVDDGGDVIINPTPYNRVYMVDAGIIEQFGNIAAFVVDSSGEYTDRLNNTDYVISLLNIPFKLPDEVAGTEEAIRLGRIDTEILAPKVESDIIRVQIGEIEVLGLQNNSLDYLQTEYVLVLPYISETIILKPEWAINKIISVEYLIDGYSGDLTVNIFNGGDYPVTFITSSIGRMIPFKTLLANPTEQGASMGAFNDTFTAYIRVSRNEVYDGEFSNLVAVEGVLGGNIGFIKVQEINLTASALSNEIDEIKNILSSGVFINA